MNKNDKQKLFEKVFDGLWKQGKFSMRTIDGKSVCAYRGKGGCKCGIGHLITDEFYKKSFEKKAASSSAVVEAVAKSQNINIAFAKSKTLVRWDTDALFLRSLQGTLHDDIWYSNNKPDTGEAYTTISKSLLRTAAIRFAAKNDLSDEFLKKYQVE